MSHLAAFKQKTWFSEGTVVFFILVGKGAARGGLKGLKPPPLAIRILMFIS